MTSVLSFLDSNRLRLYYPLHVLYWSMSFSLILCVAMKCIYFSFFKDPHHPSSENIQTQPPHGGDITRVGCHLCE